MLHYQAAAWLNSIFLLVLRKWYTYIIDSVYGVCNLYIHIYTYICHSVRAFLFDFRRDCWFYPYFSVLLNENSGSHTIVQVPVKRRWRQFCDRPAVPLREPWRTWAHQPHWVYQKLQSKIKTNATLAIWSYSLRHNVYYTAQHMLG